MPRLSASRSHRPAEASPSAPGGTPSPSCDASSRRPRQAGPLAAFLAAACLLAAFLAAPAQAQTEIWSATLTVGSSGNGNDAGYCVSGALNVELCSSAYGSLTDDVFTLDFDSEYLAYRVESLIWSSSRVKLELGNHQLPGEHYASPALSPHLVLDNTRTALAFLGNPVTERWP